MPKLETDPKFWFCIQIWAGIWLREEKENNKGVLIGINVVTIFNVGQTRLINKCINIYLKINQK